jgi:hypothetical protein
VGITDESEDEEADGHLDGPDGEVREEDAKLVPHAHLSLLVPREELEMASKATFHRFILDHVASQIHGL